MPECVCVCECEKEKTVVTTVSVELNHGCLLAWVRCYRNGMPGSDITFLAWSFHGESAKSVKPLEVCSCGLTDNSKHIDVCSMHCVSIVAGRCGQFMGLSEVPSEKKPDLKPAPDHLARRLRGFCLWGSNAWFHTSGARWFLGAGLRPVLCRAHDNGEDLRVGRRGGQRVNSSECTPGLDRPLCNYHSISFNIYLTTI